GSLHPALPVLVAFRIDLTSNLCQRLQVTFVPGSRPLEAMSQQTNSSPTPPSTPIVGKGPRRGIGAVLVLLVSLGAFAGAAAGTYVTFAYIILPHLTGSSGSNN